VAAGEVIVNKKQALKKLKMETGQTAFVGQSASAENFSTSSDTNSQTIEGENKSRDGQSSKHEVIVAPVDNDDLDKSRIRYPKFISKLTRRIRRMRIFWKPELTPAEKEFQEQKQEQARLFRHMCGEMMKANIIFPNAYYNLRIEYTPTNKGKLENQKARKVHFGKWLFSTDGRTIYGKVNKIPWGINPMRLVDPDVLTALSVSIGHPVGGKCGDEGEGVIIFVQLAGRNDFPDKIAFRDMLPKVPQDMLPLTFICGATKNGGREYRSLEYMPHFMGAGETGGGKTNLMHSMICTFISRNSPKDVRFLMIDLKFSGVALNRYKGIPHLLSVQKDVNKVVVDIPDDIKKDNLPDVPSGVANDIPSSVSILKWAYAESIRRGELFLTDKKHNPQKIEDWNNHHRTQHLPSIVIFIDELALIMDKSDVDDKAELALIKSARFYIKSLLRLARSSGVHLCGFTQCLDKSVMGIAFKTNVAGRMCFSVADAPSSILIVGDGSAVNLQKAGRAVFKRGTDRFAVQTPLIEERDIDECIRNAKVGKLAQEFAGKGILPEDLIRFAIEKGNMRLTQDRLVQEFKDQISFNDLVKKLLPDMDGRIYEVAGNNYRVIPGQGKLPRRVERV
jgi:hypothetical protein